MSANSRVLLVWLFLLPLAAWAQIQVSYYPPPKRLLEMEPIEATLLVDNQSARPIRLEPDDIGFHLETLPKGILLAQQKPLTDEEVVIPPRETRQLRVNLLHSHGIKDGGAYALKAWVRYGANTFYSQTGYFDVLEGTDLLEVKTFPAEEPEITCRFILKSLFRDGTNRLLLRIDREPGSQTYGVFDIGVIMRVADPDMRVDRQGRVHLLYLEQPKQYMHKIFSPVGREIQRQIYYGQTGGVQLRRSPEGEITVLGGTRRADEALRRVGPIRTEIGTQ